MKKAALAVAVLLLVSAVAHTPEAAPAGITHPRLLVAERDPFSGLPALRARWAGGERPSDDLPGWALSYVLSGDESYARRPVEALANTRPPQQRGANRHILTVHDAPAVDWLHGYRDLY